MKLMVTGIGGIGGYVSSVLCENYKNVTLIARKKRKDSLQKNGLILHSNYFGEHIAHPKITDNPASAGIQNIIFVCVKNYSLKNALIDILPCINDQTIVVLIMNGVNHTQEARKIMTKGHIVDTTIYINTAYNADYSITQASNFARIFIGSDNTECNQKVYSVLNHKGLTCFIAEDMQAELWNKYITNCAFNVLTAYYEGDIGDAFAKPNGHAEFRTLLEESYAVGKASGVHLKANLVDEIYDGIINLKNKNSTSSLARDIIARRQSELETFSGYLVRTARELHVPTPLSEKFYNAIKIRIQ